MADTKTVNGRVHAREDFLIADHPEHPATWHLPVKVSGVAEKRLMDAAWATLYRADGYRGQRYSGPHAAGAKRKLRALYRAEELAVPTDETLTLDEAYVGESYYGDEFSYAPRPEYVPWGATSFADVRAAHVAQEYAEQLRILTGQYTQLVENVMGSYDVALDGKIAGVRALTDEFAALLRSTQPLREGFAALADGDAPEAGVATIQEIAEGHTGHAVALEEAAAGSGDVLYLNVELIQPGWGNPRDNHYYPAATLHKAAPLFEGLKMFETDHDERTRSNRTWASTITKVTGFTESGAPIARVAVHDPEFARKARNLATLGLLEKLECSILGKGLARPYREGERSGSRIEELTAVATVEWVSRAGAGGHATSIAESAEGEAGMTKEEQQEGAAAPVATAETLVEEVVHEAAEGAPQADAAPAAAPLAEVEAAPAQPVVLSEAEVAEVFVAEHAPEIVRKWLAGRPFASAAEAQAAVREMVQDLVRSTGSGKPWGLGAAQVEERGQRMTDEEYNKRANAIARKYNLPTI
jgi:hypothetical protein